MYFKNFGEHHNESVSHQLERKKKRKKKSQPFLITNYR